MIGWKFNIINVLCQLTFPSCTLSDMDQWLSVEHKAMYILIYDNLQQCIGFKCSCTLACVAVYQHKQQYFSYLTISQRQWPKRKATSINVYCPNALLVGSAHLPSFFHELVCLLISPLPYENRYIFPSYKEAVKDKYKMKCSTCKCQYICDLIRIFRAVYF